MIHKLLHSILLALLVVFTGCARTKNENPEYSRDKSYPQFISLMQQVEAASPKNQPLLLNQIKKRLPAWYSSFDFDPPDTSNPKWTTVVGYDLMPEDTFLRAVEEMRTTLGLTVPEEVTRRQLAELINEFALKIGK
jgi:hypothetical protein